MRFNFKKISAIATSVLLTGMTLGFAAAANFPAPFVSGSTADVAIVYGANSVQLDQIQATNILEDLNSELPGGVSMSITGGESFNLYDSDNLHIGDAMNTIMDSDLDDNDLEVALADGDYDSGDIDIAYEQSITLNSEILMLITDSDLNDEEPTIGYDFDDEHVLTYTLTLKDGGADVAEMPETSLPLFGKDYYVLEADNGTVTLLNSAEKSIISEGETIEVDGHTVTLTYITSSGVIFKVDGETTDKLASGESYELSDEYWIVLSENLYIDKESGVSKAEFSLGSGKVVLTDGDEVEVNDDSIDGLVAEVTDSDMITEISLVWSTDGEIFLTESNSLEMPVFGEFGLVFNGLDFGDSEDISIENGETLVLNMENYDVELMYNTSTVENLGGKEAVLKLNATEATNKTYALAEDERFLATILDKDLPDVETVYYEVSSLNNDTAQFDLSLNDLTGANNDIDFTDADAGEDQDVGDINIEVISVYDVGNIVSSAHNTTYSSLGYVNASDQKALIDFAVIKVSSSEELHFDKVVSNSGMVIELPTTAGVGQVINFYEANEDNDVDTTVTTPSFNLSVAWDSDDDLYAKVASGATIEMVDETTDNKEVGYDNGIHATKVMEDSDSHTLEMEYYEDEVSADLKIVAGGEVSSSGGSLGNVMIMDSEASSMSSKNLIVVGGSCINSVAATMLGGSYCGPAFTSATDIGAGQFLLKSMESPYNSAKVALLVAGYEAADTQAATTYLMNQPVDTSIGKAYKGTSSTSADLIVE